MSALRLLLAMAGLHAAAAMADETAVDPDVCPVPDPPGVPSVTVPGMGVEELHALLVQSLPQEPWVIAHVDGNNVSIRRPLGEDSAMRQGWEDINGERDDHLFFDELRWNLEPLIDATVVTVRDYLIVIAGDAEEQWFEYKSQAWMNDLQCTLVSIRQVAIDNEVVPERENSL